MLGVREIYVHFPQECCPHYVFKHDTSLFSIILTSMWKMGCSAPWGRVRGILSALNPKVRQQATCFFEVTKAHMF